ncbi:Chromo domain-containing protein 2 [Cytospora mali]|uniref:Chromo domain-containing protein 2 n=1 Tax=Cytospora mali TaxID=578113 RepID=A0A194UMP4_CYTMA|nr:Chromo domain-containing protein 2 [Valsa mali var. pyri (nom. inval.)]
MPPAISDDDRSEADVAVKSDIVPKKGRGRKSYKEVEEFDDNEDMVDTKNTNGNAAEDEDEEDEDLEEDEYVVEKIFSHYIADDGEPRFEVKWEGYEKKSDRTWEPEENLRENASDALEEYFKSIGGRGKMFEETNNALKGRKRGRQSKSVTPAETKRARKNGHPRDSTPPASAKEREWKPPSGSWDDDVETVDMCQDEENGAFIVYLTWKNGKKTQHPKEVVYRRCPQKMLRFYERHIRISRDGGEPVPISSMP